MTDTKEQKKQQAEKLIRSLKAELGASLGKGKTERALACLAACSQVLYDYNQVYTDRELEDAAKALGNRMREEHREALDAYEPTAGKVLFYDGFGLDSRGVAKMYLNALLKNGYRVIYLIPETSRGNMPETEEILRGKDAVLYSYPRDSFGQWAEALAGIFLKEQPKAMLFYTTPYDASGAAAFAMMRGKAERFLIDLTDHAYWLGTGSNDFFLGSREMSASNQLYGRGIPREKLIKLGVNLMVDEAEDPAGLPFDPEKTRYVFSGGELYKTLGDAENTYYRIVDHLLEGHPDLYFLYAGSGDDREMKKITGKYSGRAFRVPERKDFYSLIRHSVFYLNTYPMFGGMMMKYAAHCGRLPLTLRHENDSDGLLVDQESREIEYDTAGELMADADRLLADPDYLAAREKKLEGSTISEERFVKNLRGALEEHRTDYDHRYSRMDTARFQEEYLERFDPAAEAEKLTKARYRSIIPRVPELRKAAVGKIFRRMLRRG